MSKLFCTRLHENSAALGNMSKLYCALLHENFLVYLFTYKITLSYSKI